MNPVTHLERVRTAATNVLCALDEVRAIDYEYTKADMGTALDDACLADCGCGLTNADLVAAVGTLRAINTLLDGGEIEHLYRLKR